ncbi:MAG: 1-acyl-sn-glycerol-3-phosphate acyltransferase [Crocinitomicaceae bacterium]
MRPVYLFLRITLPYAFSIFFRRRNIINSQRKLYAQTIFVCNHPSAFIDPLAISNAMWPIVHFMTRSDVFKVWLKPITWACHMVPIYRAEQDGAGTYEKNKKVFSGVKRVLAKKRSLIVFGEGYTDDVFIRSLKPMKKGAARIGFGTMDASDWKLDIKIQVCGVNYSDPSKFRSDMVVSCGKLIHLQDYKELYLENPAKAINQLTKDIGEELQKNITYLKDKKKSAFLENLITLTRKGMNQDHYERSLSVEQRYRYTQALANRINEEQVDEDEKWLALQEKTDEYFKKLKRKNLQDNQVNDYVKAGKTKSLFMKFLGLFVTLPVFIAGVIHNIIPYILVKTFVEKIFKRRVFWSGVKMVLGGLVWLLMYLPLFWYMPDLIKLNISETGYFYFTLMYFLMVVPFTFVWAYEWRRIWRRTMKLYRAKSPELAELSVERKALIDQMNKMGIQ